MLEKTYYVIQDQKTKNYYERFKYSVDGWTSEISKAWPWEDFEGAQGQTALGESVVKVVVTTTFKTTEIFQNNG